MCNLFLWSLKCGLNGKSLPFVWVLQIYRTISLLKILSFKPSCKSSLERNIERKTFKLSTSMQMTAPWEIASVFIEPDINDTKLKKKTFCFGNRWLICKWFIIQTAILPNQTQPCSIHSHSAIKQNATKQKNKQQLLMNWDLWKLILASMSANMSHCHLRG